MFSFFTKKNFLVDQLEGFVDIHNHILPGIDDGAKNVEESIELIKAFNEFGVKDFICTPHIMHHYYENNSKTIKNAHKQLENKLKSTGLKVSLNYAAEHMIDDNFENLLKSNEVMPLDQGHLLIEMSYLQPSINFEIAVGKIQEKQMFPVLAHPERYAYLHNDFSKYQYYRSLGIKFQLNLLSLGGYYGKEIKKVACKLLDKDLVDYLGSDVHNSRQIKSLQNVKIENGLVPILQRLSIATREVFY